MSDQYYLKFCLDIIAEKAQNGPSSLWTDGDFIDLSEAIELETGVLISRNTLKRLYSKMKTTEDYKPQKDTKNALAQYAGYKNWFEFKEILAVHVESIGAEMPINDSSGGGIEIAGNQGLNAKLFLTNQKKWFLSFIGLAFALFIVIWFLFPKNQKQDVPFTDDQLVLQILNATDTVPYSLKLKYNFPKFAEDSFTIKGFPISIYDSLYNRSEISPGYTWLILNYKRKPVISRPLHSISRKWMAFYQKKGKGTLRNIPDAYFQNRGMATPDPNFFIHHNLDSTNFLFHLRHAKNFNLNADNMVFETRFFSNLGDLDCKGLTTKLVGSVAQIEGSFFRKFCENHDFIFLPDHYYNGNRYNLSRIDLVADQWNTLRIEVKNKTAFFFLNNALVFKGTYTRSAGYLKAINLSFQGFCRFEYVRCWNEKGELIENEEF